MARMVPGLIAAVLTLACAAPAAPAAKCKPATCDAKPAIKKPAKKKPAKSKTTGWHNGTYDGGPGDPIIAPVN